MTSTQVYAAVTVESASHALASKAGHRRHYLKIVRANLSDLRRYLDAAG